MTGSINVLDARWQGLYFGCAIAPCLMVWGNLNEGNLSFLVTQPGLKVIAPRTKGTSCGQLFRIGHCASNGGQSFFVILPWYWNAFEQTLCVRMGRVFECGVDVGVFNNAPHIHHIDA